MSPRSRIRVLIGLLVVAVVCAAAVVVVVLRQDADPVADHRFVVDLGPAGPSATSVAVAGRTFTLAGADGGMRTTQVALTGGAGGLAFVRTADGTLLATAPVWSMPGVSVSDVPATCESTAFDQVLLTPGLSNPNPLAVDILWGLAHRGPAAGDLHQLGSLICARLAEPHSLATPTDAEGRSYTRLVTDIQAGIAATAAPLPALGDSLGGIGAVIGPRSGQAPLAPWPASATPSRLTHTVAGAHPGMAPAVLVEPQVPTTGSSPCGDGKAPVPAAGVPAPSLSLCAGGKDLAITNGSAAWAFLYS